MSDGHVERNGYVRHGATLIGSTRWIHLLTAEYSKGPQGKRLLWDYAARRNVPTEGDEVQGISSPAPDATVIIATTAGAFENRKIVLVAQYRPPVHQVVIEFPAGLIDSTDTDPSGAALRELKEETGYSGTVSAVGPILVDEPGLTPSRFRLIYVTIDSDALSAATHPEQHLDEVEDIAVLVVSMTNLVGTLDALAAAGNAIDAKLYTYALGLQGR